jgi:adenylate cyclase class 2
MTPYTEVEVKFILTEREAFLNQLDAQGARLEEERFEHNIRFDTPGEGLRRVGKVLRLRRIETDASTRHIVTVKAPVKEDQRSANRGIRSRHEAEFTVDDDQAFVQALELLGYAITWRYEKHRRVYTLGEVEVTLDDTPLGTIVEIEGEEKAIIKAARSLGLNMDEGLALSYAELFERVTDYMHLNVTHMTYEAFEGIDVPLTALQAAAHD